MSAASISRFFEKKLGKKLHTFFEKKVCQKTLAGCAANRGAGAAFIQAAPRTEGQALHLYRLRREQRGRRCIYTGCAANRGAGAAFIQAVPRTVGRAYFNQTAPRRGRRGWRIFYRLWNAIYKKSI
ncbi:hypothetical protein D3Z39_14935 [Anaerotruncus colihominis]|uniref:Uncharacterized protein n=1 Tax=Anaerotruncus colihominis TaxID=169435 RepID=A0A845RKQ0_9FIRM|nr:hypothetical protein [Anaerotruncus colihominis]